jgi:hypothetical protein
MVLGTSNVAKRIALQADLANAEAFLAVAREANNTAMEKQYEAEIAQDKRELNPPSKTNMWLVAGLVIAAYLAYSS